MCPEGGETHPASDGRHDVSSSESVNVPRGTDGLSEVAHYVAHLGLTGRAGLCPWPRWSQSLCLWKVLLLGNGQSGPFQEGDFCYLSVSG